MAGIWSELLDVEEIQAYDTFFDLGGHSLLSLKVVERLERETGIRMRPLDLVNQTLRQVVAGLEAHGERRARMVRGTPNQSWGDAIRGAFSRGI
jgi:acyl carrier protein